MKHNTIYFKQWHGGGIGGITAVSTVLPQEWVYRSTGSKYTGLPREWGPGTCGTTAVMGLGFSRVRVILCNLQSFSRTGLNCHLNFLFYRTTFYKVQSLLMWSFCLHTNTFCTIRTCKSHTSVHESTGMGMGRGWKKFHGDGADFHYRVTL